MADQTNAADVANKALDTVTGFIHQLTDLAQQQAPVAWELAKGVARVSGAGGLLVGFGFGIGAILTAVIGIKLLSWAKRVDPYNNNPTLIIPISFLIGSGIFTLNVLINLCYIWNWVGIFSPELWIAHSLLKI